MIVYLLTLSYFSSVAHLSYDTIKKQNIISHSSCESKYKVLTKITYESTWL